METIELLSKLAAIAAKLRRKKMQINQKNADKIGWLAAVMAGVMYASQIDQIRLNLSGRPGSILIPAILVINCVLWIIHSYYLEKKNWQVISCCVIGVITGTVTVITAIV